MENLEKPFTEDTHDRNLLQVEIINEILGPEASNEAKLSWVIEYGKTLSDIIDSPEHKDISDLARAGKYQEAAAKVLELLSVEV